MKIMNDRKSFLTTLPRELFVTKLLTGEKEFFGFVRFQNGSRESEKFFSWKITSSKNNSIFVSGERAITGKELEKGQISISALLPAEFEGGILQVKFASHEGTWEIGMYKQKEKFQLPLDGQVLIVSGHRIGEVHRSAQLLSQQFAWDLLPFHHDGLRLIKRPLSENLEAKDFEGFGQSVLAPAKGFIAKAVDGFDDLTQVGKLPDNLEYYLEDLTRALGNHVIIDHGNGVWSCNAHLKYGSIQVKEGQEVGTGDKLGELGNSGFSSGPHVHLHFMNGPDILSASPLPIELELEEGTYAPQAGEITSS